MSETKVSIKPFDFDSASASQPSTEEVVPKDASAVSAAQVETPSATEGVEKPVEQSTTTATTPAEDTAATAPVQTTTPQSTVAEQKVAKSPYEELGISDEEGFKRLVEAYKQNDIPNYMRIMSSDFDKMNDADVIREKIRRDNPTSNAKVLEYKVAAELKKYASDNFDDDEEIGVEMLKEDAQKIRDGFKKEQSEYRISPYADASKAETEKAVQEQQAQAQASFQKFEAMYKASPIAQKFETNRMVTIGEGDKAINYELSKNANLFQSLTDYNVLYGKLHNPDGTVNFEKAALMEAVLDDPKKLIAAIATKTKELADKENFESLTNPTTQTNNGSVPKAGTKVTIRPFEFS